MARPKGKRKEARISVSFDDTEYATLSALAQRRDVSVAWLIRQAVRAFIEREKAELANLQLPLIPRSDRHSHARA